MMLAYRLVRLIETHSDALGTGLLRKVENSELTHEYRNVPGEELKERVFEVYRLLGDWLMARAISTFASAIARSARAAPSSMSRSASWSDASC